MERTGIEPVTSGLQSRLRTAWINGLRSTMRKGTRSNPLHSAPARWSLARNWRAAQLGDILRPVKATGILLVMAVLALVLVALFTLKVGKTLHDKDHPPRKYQPVQRLSAAAGGLENHL
jgi:hypothetical protein